MKIEYRSAGAGDRAREFVFKNKPVSRFNARYFSKVHKFVFKDIDPMAGQFRSCLRLDGKIAEQDKIRKLLNLLGKEIKSSGYPRNFTYAGIVNFLTDMVIKTNYIYPFDIGSERVQWVFLTQLSSMAGYDLNLWRSSFADRPKLHAAKSRSDYKFVRDIVVQCMSKLQE